MTIISEQPDSESKPCIQCGLLIPQNAKICRECKNYQSGIFSWLPTSQSFLALIVALIAVVGPTFTAIHSALHKPYSELAATGASLNQGQFVLVVSNTGDAPAIVRDGSVYVNGQLFGALDSENLEASVIKPGINLIPFHFSFNNNGATPESLLAGKREVANAVIRRLNPMGKKNLFLCLWISTSLQIREFSQLLAAKMRGCMGSSRMDVV